MKEENKKVFVVTAGEGVGKFVVGLFESREAAEECRMRSVKNGPSGVVELEFNTPKSDGELKMLALEVNVGKEPDGPSNNKDCMFSGLSDKIQVVATIKNDPPKSESPKLPWYVGDDFCQ